MNEADRVKVLRIVLIVVGLIFVFGVWPLTMIWPSGWAWHTEGRSEYLEMIMGIYATLGVFLLIASRDPLAHRSLIWFPSGRASCTGESWPCSPSPNRSTSDTCGATCWPYSSSRSGWRSSRLGEVPYDLLTPQRG